MLTFVGKQVESLWDEVLPVEVRELPEDLPGLDRVLSDPAVVVADRAGVGGGARERARPSIATASFVWLMVVKQRTGRGYETLVREVSDSLHLRRFCLIGIDQPVPDESTVRKLARRLGASVVEEITRMVIEKAQRETRFTGAGGEDRRDSGGGRYPLSVRRDARAARRRGARPRGPQAPKVIGGKGAGPRPLPLSRPRRSGRSPRRSPGAPGGEDPGDDAQPQAGRLIARSAGEAERLGGRGQSVGTRPWCTGRAQSSEATGGAGFPLPRWPRGWPRARPSLFTQSRIPLS